MITEEDIEKAGTEFEADLLKGREVAQNNGVNLTKFKTQIRLGLLTEINEDQWTFDYESYLAAISRGKFLQPIDWGEDYYFGRWSL